MSTLPPRETARPRTVLGEAFAVSLLIEALILAALAGWFARQTSKPPPTPPEPIKVTITAPPPAAAAPAPALAPPKTAPAKPALSQKTPVTRAVKQTAVMKRNPAPSTPKPELPKAPAPSTQNDSQPPPAPGKVPDASAPAADATPPPRPQPQAVSSDAKPSAIFQGRMRDAVQAAVRYPGAARIMRLTGHVRLGFAYQDGTMSNPHVVQSSGQKMLDDAALAALSDTSFPAPPPELKGHLLNLEIVVTFSPSS